jgi:6-pyruvoyltetrahydropterin/6-carboxytetrahydropterin synthase
MFRVSKDIRFCYGHRLLNYDGKCRFLHGHNGLARIAIEGAELGAGGMVVDFTDIKSVMTRWIDERLDHKLLLHRDDPLIPYLQSMHEPIFVLDQNPTAEVIAKLIFDAAAEHGFPVVEVRLWESDTSCATYAPSGRSPRRG